MESDEKDEKETLGKETSSDPLDTSLPKKPIPLVSLPHYLVMPVAHSSESYAFQKFIDNQKHLDTDALRHTIKPVIHVIDKDFTGEEHLFCDKSQRCPLGKYRRPKHVIETEKRGFASGIEMVVADKKAEEEEKQKKSDAQHKEIDELKALVRQLMDRVQP